MVYKLCNTCLEAELNFVSWHLFGEYSGETDHMLILPSSEALLHASCYMIDQNKRYYRA